MNQAKKTVLANGLRVITIPKKDDLATTFLVLVEAIKKAGTNSDKIVEAFQTMKGWQGVTGQIREFTKSGEVIKNVELQVVKDSAFHYYGVVSERGLLEP